MRIYVIDDDEKSLETLLKRVKEALRRSELKRVDIVGGKFSILDKVDEDEEPCIGFIGPYSYLKAFSKVNSFQNAFPNSPVSLVLDNEIYASDAVDLRREINVRVIPIGDIVQILQFILDAKDKISNFNEEEKGVLAVTHFKGGVGASSISAGFSSLWARSGLSVALVDLDDVNPQITSWARVTNAKRELIGEFLKGGFIPRNRINEVLHPVESYDGKLAVLGQPLKYSLSFQFKADIIEDAPSGAEFVESLISSLREEFDLVVIDTGRSWGVGVFSLLPLAQKVLLVLDDDAMSVNRSLACLKRFTEESEEDSKEFDLNKWKVLLNSYTAKLLNPLDVALELEGTGLFPENSELFSLPFSSSGREWGAPGVSFYDSSDEATKYMMRDIAFKIFPFRRLNQQKGIISKIIKKFSLGKL